ncbi:unnamed protein product (mitochondrion) [Plasmodiophora brassicae]|uniref:RING-type domain-containing protein n=1 Tax=Plasmodiophora brassicae TaxID=37360 RepID=A0A0G4J0C4_PLABS|nr:hypothetical protein PBRA_008096 [Plasmodiophora brassicae]SPQ99392.1 unnamed protein product [Plasmodiophora brassicae]
MSAILHRVLPSPIWVYSAVSTAAIMAVVAPAPTLSPARLFVLAFGSPVAALSLFNFILMVVMLSVRTVHQSVFRALSDDEVSFCKDLTRSFVMFKAMYLFTALYSAQYTDLTVWFIVFTIFGAIRLLVNLSNHRLARLESHDEQRWRILALIVTLCAVNNAGAGVIYTIFKSVGWRPLLMLLIEPVLTCISCVHGMATFMMQSAEAAPLYDQSQKAFYVDCAVDIIVNSLTLAHLGHAWAMHGLSLSIQDVFFFMIVRSVYLRVATRISSLVAYRRVLHDINTRFLDASEEELRELNDHCAICRDVLQFGRTKKLPCAHYFHLTCLRQWMKYRRTCPICRADLLNNPPAATAADAAADGMPAARNGRQGWSLRRLIHFNTGQWATWMPTLSFEVVRGVPIGPAGFAAQGPWPSRDTEGDLNRLAEMFPGVPRQSLRVHLQRARGHLAGAIDDIFNNGPVDVAAQGPQREPVAEGQPGNDNVAPQEPPSSESEPVSHDTAPPAVRRRSSSSLSAGDRRSLAVSRLEALARGSDPPSEAWEQSDTQ